MSYVNSYVKLEGYPLGDWVFGSEKKSEISSAVGMLYGSILGKLGVSPLWDQNFWAEEIIYVSYSVGISVWEVSVRREG